MFNMVNWPWRERASKLENFNTQTDWLSILTGGLSTTSGVSVSEDSALSLPVFYACIKAISEDVAKVPLFLYKRDGETRERIDDNALSDLFHYKANNFQNSFEFREYLQQCLLIKGNAFAYIEYGPDMWPIALWPLNPDRISMEILEYKNDPGRITYNYSYNSKNNKILDIPQHKIFHLKMFSQNGYWGRGVLDLQREVIGLGLAEQEFGARFFSDDAKPRGIIKIKRENVTEEQRKTIRKSWEESYSGLDKKFKVAVLPDLVEWQTISISPNDAQWLESRRFTVEQVARMFRMPLHKIASLEKPSYASIEQQSLEYVQDTLLSQFIRWEKAINCQLIPPKYRREYYVEHKLDVLLRGDTESRFRAYSTALQWGILSHDEIRQLENRNPIPDGKGNRYWMPMNISAFTGDDADNNKMTTKIGFALDGSKENDPIDKMRENIHHKMRDDKRDDLILLREAWHGPAALAYKRAYARIANDLERLAAKNDKQNIEERMIKHIESAATFLRESLAPLFAGYYRQLNILEKDYDLMYNRSHDIDVHLDEAEKSFIESAREKLALAIDAESKDSIYDLVSYWRSNDYDGGLLGESRGMEADADADGGAQS